MKHHTIDLKELQSWLNDDPEVTFASSTRERKRLVASVSGMLTVLIAGKVIWSGTNPSTAVEKYNAITEKYVEPKYDIIL